MPHEWSRKGLAMVGWVLLRNLLRYKIYTIYIYICSTLHKICTCFCGFFGEGWVGMLWDALCGQFWWFLGIYLPIFFRVTSLSLGQSYDCPQCQWSDPEGYEWHCSLSNHKKGDIASIQPVHCNEFTAFLFDCFSKTSLISWKLIILPLYAQLTYIKW